jgi:hypothetical protein
LGDNLSQISGRFVMRATWGLFVAVPAVLFCLVSAPSAVRADDEAYEKAIADGIAEFDRGNYPEAKVLFRMAHNLDPNARTLRGMGMTAFEMREYVNALALLELALIHKKKPLTKKQREHMEGLVSRCRVFIATYKVELDPPDAIIMVDGSRGTVEAGSLLLDPGEHELVVKAEGYRKLIRRVRAEGGKQGTLELELEPEPASARAAAVEPARPEPAVVAEPAPAEEPSAETGSRSEVSRLEPAATGERSDSGTGRLWTWVAAGGAVAFAGAAAIFWTLGNGEYSDIEDECNRIGCPTTTHVEAVAEDTSLNTYETLTTVSLVFAGAALVSSGVLFFVQAPADEEKDRATLHLGPTGVLVRGSF